MALRAIQSAVTPEAGGEQVYTAQEAAVYLRVKEQTLACWRCSKKPGLPYIKAGRKVLYRKAALDAFLLAGEVAA
jgi:excisionase family DNA binding protein